MNCTDWAKWRKRSFSTFTSDESKMDTCKFTAYDHIFANIWLSYIDIFATDPINICKNMQIRCHGSNSNTCNFNVDAAGSWSKEIHHNENIWNQTYRLKFCITKKKNTYVLKNKWAKLLDSLAEHFHQRITNAARLTGIKTEITRKIFVS